MQTFITTSSYALPASALALTTTSPVATPLRVPLASIVASPSLSSSIISYTTFVLTGFLPSEREALALSVSVFPTATDVALRAVNSTLSAGNPTIIEQVAFLPLPVRAVIVALPSATAVTVPFSSTLATSSSELVKVIVSSQSSGRIFASSLRLPKPTAIAAFEGTSVIFVMGTHTFTETSSYAVSVPNSAVALTTTVP